jgi:hypothetical protein
LNQIKFSRKEALVSGYQIADRKDSRALTEFLQKEGQRLGVPPIVGEPGAEASKTDELPCDGCGSPLMEGSLLLDTRDKVVAERIRLASVRDVDPGASAAAGATRTAGSPRIR